MSRNTFNLVGTIDTLEEREFTNGDGQYKMLKVYPSWCERRITLFVTPSYKNGEENKVYKELEQFKAGDYVKLTLSPFNSRLFLFNIKPFKKEEC